MQDIIYELDGLSNKIKNIENELSLIQSFTYQVKTEINNIKEDCSVNIMNKSLANVGGFVFSKIFNQPEAYKFFKIAINEEDKETTDYINKNACFY